MIWLLLIALGAGSPPSVSPGPNSAQEIASPLDSLRRIDGALAQGAEPTPPQRWANARLHESTGQIPAKLALLGVPSLWAQGRYLEAASLLSQAQPDPTFRSVLELLTAESLGYGGRGGEAIDRLKILAGTRDDPPMAQLALVRLGELESQLAPSTESPSTAFREAGAHPLGARLRARRQAAEEILRARQREAAGDWPGAQIGLETVIGRWTRLPEAADALYLEALFSLQRGERLASKRLFQRLILRPGRHREEARWWLGWGSYLDGELEAALHEWEPLATHPERTPLGPQILYWSAVTLQRLGHPQQLKLATARRKQLRSLAPLSYYALLAAVPAGVGLEVPPSPSCQASLDPDGELSSCLRRGELLWALGLKLLAASELDRAARIAQMPAEILALSEVESALGEPGQGYALIVDRAKSCFGATTLSSALFPRPFLDEVGHAARAEREDPLLLWAIMRQESRFQIRARSAAQAEGAMQLLPPTRSRVALLTGVGESPSAEPTYEDLQLAAWYLTALKDRFGGSAALTIAAYNAGPEAVAHWQAAHGADRLDVFIEEIPFRETRRYVKAVLANYAAYRALYGEGEGEIIDPTWVPGQVRDGISF